MKVKKMYLQIKKDISDLNLIKNKYILYYEPTQQSEDCQCLSIFYIRDQYEQCCNLKKALRLLFHLNQNAHKGRNQNTYKDDNKNTYKGDNKNPYKEDNKNNKIKKI